MLVFLLVKKFRVSWASFIHGFVIRTVRGFDYRIQLSQQPPLIENVRDGQLIRETEDVVFCYHEIDSCHAFVKPKQ